MRIFSSILPFTNRFGLQRATCISSWGAIGGLGGERQIRPCPIWEDCNFCTQTVDRQFPPSKKHLVPLNCPRCGGEFEILTDDTGLKADFPTLGDCGRILISGEIARHNLHRHVNPSISPYHVFSTRVNEGYLRGLTFPPKEECMDLVLQGLVYLSEQSNSQQPLATGDRGRWAFLMACSYSPGEEEVESFIRGLKEKALVRLPSGSVDSAEVAKKGHERYKSLVEAMHKSSQQENQGS